MNRLNDSIAALRPLTIRVRYGTTVFTIGSNAAARLFLSSARLLMNADITLLYSLEYEARFLKPSFMAATIALKPFEIQLNIRRLRASPLSLEASIPNIPEDFLVFLFNVSKVFLLLLPTFFNPSLHSTIELLTSFSCLLRLSYSL